MEVKEKLALAQLTVSIAILVIMLKKARSDENNLNKMISEAKKALW